MDENKEADKKEVLFVGLDLGLGESIMPILDGVVLPLNSHMRSLGVIRSYILTRATHICGQISLLPR